MTVKNNVVNTPGNINNGFNGLLLTNGSVSATDDFTTRIDISNNDFRGSGPRRHSGSGRARTE